MKENFINFPPNGTEAKTKEGLGGNEESGRESRRKSPPCGLLYLGLAPRADQASPLGLARVPGSRNHPQKHSPGDSEAHKATLLGDLQTDYKFTGDNQGI